MRRFDIIPDIHADLARLNATLTSLGYRKDRSGWCPPEGHVAAFLGDFIDGGPDNRAVVETVRGMVEAGHAVAIMGNHELNALLYHSAGKNAHGADDGFMRAHSEKNTGQHASFLKEFPLGGEDTKEVLDWFLTLPLFLDLGALRLVHACWHAEHVGTVAKQRADGRLRAADLQEVAEGVCALLKGLETHLPEGYSFRDYHGNKRTEVRVKWWARSGATWRDVALSVPSLASLPDTPYNGDLVLEPYAPDAPPVFFGHYKRTGRPTAPDSRNVMCLDYPQTPCAYRWQGEDTLSADNIITIDASALA